MIKKHEGFTLVEILIALVIFAVVGIMATVGLSAVLKARDRSNIQMQNIQQMQLAFIIMKQDFSQMAARPVIDNTGNQSPALVEQVNYIEFTRAGYINPLMALPRSTLQRVAYIFKNHQLIRRSWPVLDRAPDTQASDKVLLTGLDAVRFNFLDNNKQFTLIWPPASNGQNVQKQLPAGIKIDFNFKKLGSMAYLFLIPASSNDAHA